jgi:hypothetical protein
MPESEPSGVPLVERLERLLEAPSSRLVLSFLIVLSLLPHGALGTVLPAPLVPHVDTVFLALFTPEFVLRVLAYLRHRRERTARRAEVVLLFFDFLALLSFLPLHGYFAEASTFRLFRLSRMLLLVGYWSDMLSDLWAILSGRERRHQLVFVLLLGVVLSFAGAALVAELAPGFDYDDDGDVDATDGTFRHMQWWAFRQSLDPGNTPAGPPGFVVTAVSVALTYAGVVMLAFLIGISTGAMEELVDRARERPLGLRDHTVILGLRSHSHLMLAELAGIYRKNVRRLNVAVLGPWPEAPEYFHERSLRHFHYRNGDPLRPSDLARVDVARASRVLLVGQDEEEPDARVVGALLAVRSQNASAQLYPDLEHEKNFLAALSAGGPRTQLIGSGPFLGYYIAQNVIYPGIQRAYRELLTTAGSEIYTYLFTDEERKELGKQPPVDGLALLLAGWQRRICVIGVFVGGRSAPIPVLNLADPGTRDRHEPVFEGDLVRPGKIFGLVGVALRWSDLARFARSLAESGLPIALPRAEPQTTSLVPTLSLHLPAPPVRRVLVCGSGGRVPRVLSELFDFYGQLDATVLVRDPANLDLLPGEVHAALSGYLAGAPAGGNESWRIDVMGEERQVRGDRGGRVRIVHADWSDAAVMLRHPAADPGSADAILFLPRQEGDVADGLLALDCLRTAEFGRSGRIRHAEGARVVAMLRDPVKAELLERRLDEMAGPGSESRFTVLSSERLRHHFTVQSLFVRGLNGVLLELLGASGQHLCRVVPRMADGRRPSGDVEDALALVKALYTQHAAVLVGYDNAAGEPVLGPPRVAAGSRLAWADVRALYVVMDGRRLAPSP